jgi:hypothetical protein
LTMCRKKRPRNSLVIVFYHFPNLASIRSVVGLLWVIESAIVQIMRTGRSGGRGRQVGEGRNSQ